MMVICKDLHMCKIDFCPHAVPHKPVVLAITRESTIGIVTCADGHGTVCPLLNDTVRCYPIDPVPVHG